MPGKKKRAKNFSHKSSDLNRNTAFSYLWAGETASQIGFQVAGLATSAIAITLLHATNGQVGTLNALQTIAFLLVGLPAGAWVDHWRKRRVMITADLVRAIALISVPVAWVAGHLTLIHLMIVAAIISFASVFFDVAYQSYVPQIVKRSQIAQANGRLEASFQVARIGGPGLAGWLLGIISAPFAYMLTALTYAMSALAIWRIPQKEEKPKVSRGSILAQMGEGIAFVRSQPLLFPLFICISAAAFTGQGVQVLLPVLALRDLNMSASTLGLLLSLGAVGGLVGVAHRAWYIRHLGEGHTIVACNILGVTATLALPASIYAGAGAVWVIIASNMISSYFLTIYNVTQLSLRQRLCPIPLLGRLNATFRFAVWGMMPIGSLAAGWLADHLGVTTTMYIFIAGTIWAGIAMSFTPAAKLNERAQ